MSKFEEFCDVNGTQVKAMCRTQGTTVKEVGKKIGICTTSMYNYLNRGRMPCKMAHAMMDAIWDRNPPFYFDDEITCHPEQMDYKRLVLKPIYPAHYINLLEARRQIDIAIRKIQEAVEGGEQK